MNKTKVVDSNKSSNNLYANNFIRMVVDNSKSKSWDSAKQEWKIVSCKEDCTCMSACLCGKTGIKYLYSIKNVCNENILFPIGSSCIEKFESNVMDEEVGVTEELFRLYHAFRHSEESDLEFFMTYFSRKLLEYFYDEDVFVDTVYNNYDGWNDYEFLLEMFNKRNKRKISYKQVVKMFVIINKYIKPYVYEKCSSR